MTSGRDGESRASASRTGRRTASLARRSSAVVGQLFGGFGAADQTVQVSEDPALVGAKEVFKSLPVAPADPPDPFRFLFGSHRLPPRR